VTIASVLGTGILALPVKTANRFEDLHLILLDDLSMMLMYLDAPHLLFKSGFWPFFVMFVLVLIFEEAVILYAIDIMQRARYLNGIGITTLEELRATNPDNVKQVKAV